jgi:hypothetical protein
MNETPNHPINDALRSLKESDAQREAASRVEAALLQAFRLQHAPVTTPVRRSFASLFTQRRPAWGFALAAAALLVVGFAWWNWRAATTSQSVKNDIVLSPSPAPTQAPEMMPTPEVQAEPRVQFVAQRKPPVRRAAPKAATIQAEEEEITTEFFPLVTQDVLPERGQLRRVKVPRSTLINFGLPVNGERLEFPINADLLVGEDGAARAIRFVQDRQDRFPSETFINHNSYGSTLPAAYRRR